MPRNVAWTCQLLSIWHKLEFVFCYPVFFSFLFFSKSHSPPLIEGMKVTEGGLVNHWDGGQLHLSLLFWMAPDLRRLRSKNLPIFTCFNLFSSWLVSTTHNPHHPPPLSFFCGQIQRIILLFQQKGKQNGDIKLFGVFGSNENKRKQKTRKDKKRKQQTNSKMITNITKMKFPLFSI